MPSLEASIGRLRECLVKTESQAREMERHEMKRRGEESRLHLAAEYLDELLTDCRRGTEEPVELPKRMRAREAFEATRRRLPKKPTE